MEDKLSCTIGIDIVVHIVADVQHHMGWCHTIRKKDTANRIRREWEYIHHNKFKFENKAAETYDG